MAKKYDPEEANKTIAESLDRVNKLYNAGDVEAAIFASEETQALADVARYRQMEADKAEFRQTIINPWKRH